MIPTTTDGPPVEPVALSNLDTIRPCATLKLVRDWHDTRGVLIPAGTLVRVRQSIAPTYVNVGVAELVRQDDPARWYRGLDRETLADESRDTRREAAREAAAMARKSRDAAMLRDLYS